VDVLLDYFNEVDVGIWRRRISEAKAQVFGDDFDWAIHWDHVPTCPTI